MPAKRKAAQKAAAPAESSRPTRSTENKAGSKRKASPSPAPPAKKGVGARRGATETDAKDTKETSRQSARGRSASKQTEEPKPTRGGSRTATRSAVVAEETKKAASRGRSKTPSTPQKKTQSTPKSTPKTRTETPKQKATPTQKAATPRQRSATPKSKPSTPKQKAATPKQKAVTPKQKNATPKQKTATPKAKQEKQKSTPKQKPTPKAKQKSTPVKTPVKKTPQKKEESPKKDKEEESKTEPEKSPDSAKKRKSPAKRETPPSKSARASSRSRGREEKAEEEIKDDKEQTDQTAEEEPAENTSTVAATAEPEQTASEKQEEAKDEEVAEKPEEETAEIDQGKPEQVDKDDEEEAMETTEASNEDENVEQDQIVEKNESAESEEAAVEESKESESVQDKAETIEEDAEAEKVEAENVEAESEDIEEVQETENTEAENVEEKMEDNEDPLAVDEQVEDVQSTEADKPADPEPVSIEAEPEVPSQKDADDVKESQAESEQVVIADNENDVVESEQVEADNPEPQSNTAAGDPIVINEDSGDSAQPEVISDDSENGEGKVIEVNDDSGDAVIVMDSSEVGSGDNADKTNEQVNAEAEQQVVNLDDETGVELAEEAIENDFAATSDSTTGNGTSHLEDGESKKRKIDDVEDAEESGEFSKKLKSSVEVENVTENGSVSQEEGNVDDDFVVIEMSDVPPVDSSEIKESIPQEVVNTNNIDNSVNPIFNREFVPNPAFSGQADASKQFSVVSYNILADCHLFRNDYSFTDSKYLVPEYRLEKIIEELKYLDGDVICMQEVDPSFFSEKLLPSLQSIGYEGFHKKREADYFNEGEATFYKTGRFTLVECQLHRQAELVEKVLSEGAMDPSIQDAVRKYVDMPDVLVVTKLRCNNTGSELTVGNVHINWGEMKTPDIQCVQIASAIREALSRAGSDSVPHIICGDFNSPPLSPGYVVARDGYPNGDETITRLQQITGLQLPEGKVDSLVNCLWPAFQHTSSALKSAYFEAQGREPEITSYNQVMCECVDYIFYSSTSIDNVGVFRVADKQKIMETGGTPNIYFPSDHVSMKAVLAFK